LSGGVVVLVVASVAVVALVVATYYMDLFGRQFL
jgi:hypothetical protein